MGAGSSSTAAAVDDDDDDNVAVVACKSLRFIPPPLSVFSRSRPHKIHLDLDRAFLCAAAVFGDYSNYLTCVIAPSVISRRTPLFLPSPSRAVPRSGQWSNRNSRAHSRQLGANGNGLVNTRVIDYQHRIYTFWVRFVVVVVMVVVVFIFTLAFPRCKSVLVDLENIFIDPLKLKFLLRVK